MPENLLNFFVVIWPWLLASINILLVVVCTVHIVLRKRDVRAAISWTGLVWLAPLLGAAAYFCFGINRIQRRAAELYVKECWSTSAPVLTPEEEKIQDEFIAAHPTLVGVALVAQRLTGTFDLPGNRVIPLIDGDQAYPARQVQRGELVAIRARGAAHREIDSPQHSDDLRLRSHA